MKSGQLELKGGESASLFQALSSPTRRQILSALRNGPASVRDLARALSVSRPAVTRHIQELEAAGLVSASLVRDGRGQQKLCRLEYDAIAVSFDRRANGAHRVAEVEMPVGLYTTIEASPPCGLAGAVGIIGAFDNPQSFYLPERVEAEFLWNGNGFVEYAFPNQLPPGAELHRIELAVEIGSEIALHRIDIPSDITVWLNGMEVGTWTSVGGLGARRGHLTPAWWWDSRTQHGVLKVWAVDGRGSFVDGARVSDLRVEDVPLQAGGSILVRIGFRRDAQNVGGFNLFGRRFGNYEQGLLLSLRYTEAALCTEATAARAGVGRG